MCFTGSCRPWGLPSATIQPPSPNPPACPTEGYLRAHKHLLHKGITTVRPHQLSNIQSQQTKLQPTNQTAILIVKAAKQHRVGNSQPNKAHPAIHRACQGPRSNAMAPLHRRSVLLLLAACIASAQAQTWAPGVATFAGEVRGAAALQQEEQQHRLRQRPTDRPCCSLHRTRPPSPYPMEPVAMASCLLPTTPA